MNFVSKTYILTLGARGTARTVAKVVFKRHLCWSNVWKSSPRNTLSSPPISAGVSWKILLVLRFRRRVLYCRVFQSARMFQIWTTTSDPPPTHGFHFLLHFLKIICHTSASFPLGFHFSFHIEARIFDSVKRKINLRAEGCGSVTNYFFKMKWKMKSARRVASLWQIIFQSQAQDEICWGGRGSDEFWKIFFMKSAVGSRGMV